MLKKKELIEWTIAFALFCETCLNGTLLWLTALILISFSMKIVCSYSQLVNGTLIWIMIVMLATYVLAVNADITQFSYIYCIIVWANIFLSFLMLINNEGIFLQDMIKRIATYTFFISSIYIFIKEISMLIFRWKDFINGNSGYRLGVSSNINPNSIAWLYGFLAIVFLIYAKQNKFYYIFYFICFVFILFTGSKSGIICAILPIFYWGFLALKDVNLKTLIAVIVISFLFWKLIQTIPLLYTLIGSRIDQFFAAFGLEKNNGIVADAGSTLKRIDMIKVATSMFWEKPLLGWGIGSFAKYSGFGYYCHNNYMEILVSGGIFLFPIIYGYILYLLLITIFNIKNNKNLEIALFMIVSNLLLDFGSVNFYGRFLYYFKYMIAVAFLIYYRCQKTKDGGTEVE